jgi:hypothetical protein
VWAELISSENRGGGICLPLLSTYSAARAAYLKPHFYSLKRHVVIASKNRAAKRAKQLAKMHGCSLTDENKL